MKKIIYKNPNDATNFDIKRYVKSLNRYVKISEAEALEIRDRGYIGKFRGVPVVVMPQSFTDETNAKTTMNPSLAYVIPAGKEKIIKLAFEGNSYFREWDDHEGDNSITLQAYSKVGIAVVSTPNYWGIYYNRGIDAGDVNDPNSWAYYNQSLT